jgi:hypothetical protein
MLFSLFSGNLRQVQSLGYAVEYSNNLEFAINIQKLVALAFLPVEAVVNAFLDLFDTGVYRMCLDLIDYMERTWVGMNQTHGSKRKEPLFPVD